MALHLMNRLSAATSSGLFVVWAELQQSMLILSFSWAFPLKLGFLLLLCV